MCEYTMGLAEMLRVAHCTLRRSIGVTSSALLESKKLSLEASATVNATNNSASSAKVHVSRNRQLE